MKSPFEERIGYCRAIRCNGWIFVAGTTGYDYATMRMIEDAAGEYACALATTARASGELDAGMADVVRVRYVLPDATDGTECRPLAPAASGAAPPVATMISAGLQDPAMRIEIQVTARDPLDVARPMSHMSGGSSGART